MNKLCDCKKDSILSYLYARKTPLANEIVAAQIVKLIESECICSLGTASPHEQKGSNSIPLVCEDVNEVRLLKQCPTCYVKYSTKLDDSDYQEEQELNEPVLKELSDFTKSICDSMGSPTENLKENNQKLKAFAKRYFSKEEKKECEHAPADVKQGWVFNSLTSYPLWLCKCGLVTCKNPNE